MYNRHIVKVKRLRAVTGRNGYLSMAAGTLVQSRYLRRWYGVVEEVGFRGDTPFVTVRMVCTVDGRRFRKPQTRSLDPAWFSVVSTLPIREGAEEA